MEQLNRAKTAELIFMMNPAEGHQHPGPCDLCITLKSKISRICAGLHQQFGVQKPIKINFLFPEKPTSTLISTRTQIRDNEQQTIRIFQDPSRKNSYHKNQMGNIQSGEEPLNWRKSMFFETMYRISDYIQVGRKQIRHYYLKIQELNQAITALQDQIEKLKSITFISDDQLEEKLWQLQILQENLCHQSEGLELIMNQVNEAIQRCGAVASRQKARTVHSKKRILKEIVNIFTTSIQELMGHCWLNPGTKQKILQNMKKFKILLSHIDKTP